MSRIRGFGLPSIAADHSELAAMKQFIGESLAASVLRPAILKILPLDEIVAGQRYFEAGTQIGKIVVTV